MANSEAKRIRRSPAQQIARDSGYGRRCISHYRENPYSIATDPDLHAEWEQGWEKADAEANTWAEKNGG